MKNFPLTGPVRINWFKLLLCFFLLGMAIVVPGCRLSEKPSQRVESFLRTLERGDIDQAVTFLSSGMTSRIGVGAVKAHLSSWPVALKKQGGIKSFRVLSEEVVGEVAEVACEITMGNGMTDGARYKLIKEQGVWKIDEATSLSSSQDDGADPLRPESAANDVTTWAREVGATEIRNWLKAQPPPPICTTTPADSNSLPDEVRYHEVDDSKVKGRLMAALDPVLKLAGCASVRGIVLYKGSTTYAFNLDGGRIAITPGDLYFTGAQQDETIFHSSAELRIFLARELFRQMVPAGEPRAGLNKADMMLRQELKLNYLAAMASLAIDHDRAVLERAALDVQLYGKPSDIVTGTPWAPTLQQIEDVFGAARQDYRE